MTATASMQEAHVATTQPQPAQAATAAKATPAPEVVGFAVPLDILRQVCTAAAPLVDEVAVHLTPGAAFAVTAKAVDPAHVAMVELAVPSGVVEWDRPGAGEPMTAGLDVEKLLKRLRAFDKKSLVEVAVALTPRDARDARRQASAVDLTQGRLTRSLGCVDTTATTDPKVPKLDLPVKVRLPAEELAAALAAAADVSDHVTFQVKGGTFSCVAKGDTDTDRWTHPVKEGAEAKSLFSLDYLRNILKAAGQLADEVEVNLGTDYPVRLEVVSADGVRVTYLLAPRIES